jgi:hypothetical protein
MRRPPIEYLIAQAYRRSMPWAAKVERLPGDGLWWAWIIGEHVPANDDRFEAAADAQTTKPQDTLAP